MSVFVLKLKTVLLKMGGNGAVNQGNIDQMCLEQVEVEGHTKRNASDGTQVL